MLSLSLHRPVETSTNLWLSIKIVSDKKFIPAPRTLVMLMREVASRIGRKRALELEATRVSGMLKKAHFKCLKL